jgi:hypothetical protein
MHDSSYSSRPAQPMTSCICGTIPRSISGHDPEPLSSAIEAVAGNLDAYACAFIVNFRNGHAALPTDLPTDRVDSFGFRSI